MAAEIIHLHIRKSASRHLSIKPIPASSKAKIIRMPVRYHSILEYMGDIKPGDPGWMETYMPVEPYGTDQDS